MTDRVGSWVERRARVAPRDVAIIHGTDRLTYAQMAARIRRLANGLLDLGVVPGDRLAWLGPNHPAFLETLFAAGLLGCALAPVNHRVTPATVGAVLRDVEPRIVLATIFGIRSSCPARSVTASMSANHRRAGLPMKRCWRDRPKTGSISLSTSPMSSCCPTRPGRWEHRRA